MRRGRLRGRSGVGRLRGRCQSEHPPPAYFLWEPGTWPGERGQGRSGVELGLPGLARAAAAPPSSPASSTLYTLLSTHRPALSTVARTRFGAAAWDGPRATRPRAHTHSAMMRDPPRPKHRHTHASAPAGGSAARRPGGPAAAGAGPWRAAAGSRLGRPAGHGGRGGPGGRGGASCALGATWRARRHLQARQHRSGPPSKAGSAACTCTCPAPALHVAHTRPHTLLCLLCPRCRTSIASS